MLKERFLIKTSAIFKVNSCRFSGKVEGWRWIIIWIASPFRAIVYLSGQCRLSPFGGRADKALEIADIAHKIKDIPLLYMKSLWHFVWFYFYKMLLLDTYQCFLYPVYFVFLKDCKPISLKMQYVLFKYFFFHCLTLLSFWKKEGLLLLNNSNAGLLSTI